MRIWKRQVKETPTSILIQPERGQAMVEFALSFSIFLMMLIGLLALAMVFFSYVTANNAAREGARYLIGHPTAANSDVIDYICTTSIALGGSKDACKAGAMQPTSPNPQMTFDKRPESGGYMKVTIDFTVPIPRLSISFMGNTLLMILGPITVEGKSIMYVE